MRTTIDIPDLLFREIKSAAALRGETLKAFVLRAVQKELEGGMEAERRKPHRITLPLVKSKGNEKLNITAETLSAIQEEEDIDLATRY